jgi:hypothetical protein
MPSLLESLEPTLHQAMLPALAGAAGGGALSAYATSRSRDPRENPAARRKRILRNALLGTLAGGFTGAAVPTGATMLAEPFVGGKTPPLLERGMDSALGATAAHALPLGVAGAGAYGIHKTEAGNRQRAMADILKSIPKEGVPGGLHPANEAQLLDLLATPEGRSRVMNLLTHSYHENPLHRYSTGMRDAWKTLGLEALPPEIGRSTGGTNAFLARERLQEAGAKAPSLREMAQQFGPGNKTELFGGAGKPPLADVLAQYRQYLSEQGPVSRQVSRLADMQEMPAALRNLKRFPAAEWLSRSSLGNKAVQAVENFQPYTLAERWGNLVRPGTGAYMGGRLPLLAKLGLLGSGVLGASYLQNKVMGKA